jgi:hypothetical protein
VLYCFVQINPKFFKIQPSPATPSQRKSKKKAWISLDSLGGNEPFQRVIVTPRAKNLSRLHSLAIGLEQLALSLPAAARVTRTSNFHKQNASAYD